MRLEHRWKPVWIGAALGVICASLLPQPAAAERQSHYALAQHAIDGYIVPSIGAFDGESHKLAAATEAFCAAPDAAKRRGVVASFGDALAAWAEVEVIRTGPAAREGRAQKIAFWPDPRGVMERQLRQALAAHQPEIAEAGALRAQSAALQGFPALEFLIADKSADLANPDEEGRYRCRVATAIATNIAGLAHEIHDGWVKSEGWRDHMLRPGSDNTDYPSAEAAATDIFKSLTTSLQAILEAQIRPLAGEDKDKKPKASSQAYHRLGLSRDYLLAGIKACHALYGAAGLPGYLDAGDTEQKKLLDMVETAFTQAEHLMSSKAWDDAGRADGDDSSRMPVRAAASMLGGARRIIATKIADAAEITLGFNELDGD